MDFSYLGEDHFEVNTRSGPCVQRHTDTETQTDKYRQTQTNRLIDTQHQ